MFELHQAIATLDTILFQVFIEQPAAINRKWAHGWTPLHFVCAAYARHAQGYTAQCRTKAKLYDSMCEQLLEKGADPFLCDDKTQTPAALAAGFSPPSLRAHLAQKAEAGEFDKELLNGAVLPFVVSATDAKRRLGNAHRGIGQLKPKLSARKLDWASERYA